MTTSRLLILLISCVCFRAGTTALGRNIVEANSHFYVDQASALIMYLMLTWVCVRAFALKEIEQRIVGNAPNHLQVNLAALCGIMFALFVVGEHGFEVYLVSQVDQELVGKIWNIYDAKYRGLVPTFSLDTILFYFVGVVAAPIGEEYFFRGLLLPTMMKRYSFIVAAALSSFVFTSLHFQHQFYLSTFLFSFVLCRIYVLYNSLWVCILIHATYNLIVFTLENVLGMGRIYSTDQISLLTNWTGELLAFGVSSIFLVFVFGGPNGLKSNLTGRAKKVGVTR